MTWQRRARIAPTTLALAVCVAACGGGAGSAPSADGTENGRVVTDDSADVSSDVEPEARPEAGVGPVNGALYSVLSAELGLAAIDRDTGAITTVTSSDVDYVERNRQPITFGGTSYTTAFTTLEGQSFSHGVSIVGIDRSTSTLSHVAELGVDRASDEASDSTGYTLDAVDAASAWVTVVAIVDGNFERSIRRYDIASGSMSAEWVEPSFEITTDGGGSCSDGISGVTSSVDGSADGLFAISNGWPVRVDLDGQTIDGLVDLCGDDAPLLEQFIDAGNIADFVVTESGDSIAADPESIADLLFFERPLVTGDQIVVADGRVWWYFNDFLASGDDGAYVGGIAEFDIASGSLSALHPLGDIIVTWLPDDADFDADPLSGELMWSDGQLWMMDTRNDGQLLRIDPNTDAVDAFPVDAQGTDYTSASFIRSDPDAVWLAITRWTRDPDNDGSSSGDRFVQRIDADTGTTSLDIDETELIRS